ncbi:hypothetical protein BDF14DRAFT_300332 [Spinellus fusiger]|nr:hypothetical protein BDF14DRAFT_300332 [Spinellus fusiger]
MSRKTSKTITAKNTKQTTLRGYFLDTATTVKSLDTPRVSINREDIPLQNSVLTTTDTSVDKGTTTTTAGRGISYNNQELSYRVFGQDKRQVINQKSLNLCDPSVPTAPVYSSQEIVQTSPSLPLLSPLRTAPKNRAAYPRQQFNPGERTLPSILIEDPWNTSGKRSNSSYTHFENNYPFQAKAKTFSLKNYRHQPKRQKSRGPSNEYAPPLSNEQQAILNMIVDQKESVFFTGSAGRLQEI